MRTKYRLPIFVFIAILGVYLNSCMELDRNEDALTPTNPATDSWSSFLKIKPHPYTTPLPNPDQTPLDGTYAKYDPSYPQWWACRRCAEYRPAGGVWRMRLDRGVMHIYYEVTGWRNLASYTVSGDRLYLFNDPICKEEIGEYAWKLVAGNLSLEVVDDPCSFQLRGQNLSGLGWKGCQPPPSGEAWEEPRGCKNPEVEMVTTSTLPGSLQVVAHEGDARKADKLLDVLVNASGVEDSSLEDIRLSFSEDSILYGHNRVLWAENDWLEISTEGPYSSMGVQFLGDHVIGWARVFFDGEEVWRGDTSTIWSEFGRFGGYIEISGFEPGEHVLRVERLGVDSRPVVVAFLGFHR
jgi:hypothetical protein